MKGLVFIRISFSDALNRSVSLSSGHFRTVFIDGASPYTHINAVENAAADGGTFISQHVMMRRISLLICVTDNFNSACAELSGFFLIGGEGSLSFSYDNGKTRSIFCRTEKFDYKIAEGQCNVNISLLCISPFFFDQSTECSFIHAVSPSLHFPLSIPLDKNFIFAEVDNCRIGVISNGGDISTGCIFTIFAFGEVVRPFLQDTVSYDKIALNVSMSAGDVISIDTRNGIKSIVLRRSGTEYDIINSLEWGSSFLQLKPGYNRIGIYAESGEANIMVKVEFTPLYGGV